MKTFDKIIRNVSFTLNLEKQNSTTEYPAASRVYLNPMLPAHRNDNISDIIKSETSNNISFNIIAPKTTPRTTPRTDSTLSDISVGAISQNFNNIIYLELNTYSFDKHKLTVILTYDNGSSTAVLIYKTFDQVSPKQRSIGYVVDLLMHKQNKEKINPDIPFYWHHDFNDAIKGNIVNNKLVFV